ncbi:hypothetical protein SPI_08152 [Niveomyces insectorum RCEF 264]|uniref:Pre-rRNA processing protein n=1 Tax=Niveomyces insectorum RCEF 264 TaxID=1081102 RepID=A0A162IED4_9HYPO|nr:hypothetical protein SPI_08152 [Niveomyces insectorum RCEF 264]
MADSEEERSPLLSESESASGRPGPSSLKRPAAAETTPLLARGSDEFARSYSGASHSTDGASGHSRTRDGDNDSDDDQDENDRASVRSSKNPGKRWPSIVAIVLLAFVSVSIIVVAFFAPAAVEEYAKQGTVIEPTNLSLESLTTDGVRARIQANVRLDGSRVKNEQVRRIGRATTWIVRKLGTDKTVVSVYLPEYANVLLGSAEIPPLVVDLVDGHSTAVDFVADLVPGDAEGFRSIANQWLEGRLDSIRLQAKADIRLSTGLIPLGTHFVSESLVFEAKDIPEIPKYDIDRIIFEEVDVPGMSNRAMGAEVLISAFNKFPVQIDIPPLGFDIFVPNCNPVDPYIQVADAITGPVAVRPQSVVVVDVNGTVQELPDSLTTLCPDSNSSPLDAFLKRYLNGDEATVFVRGKRGHSVDTPDWISDILASVTVPVPFPGRTFDNLIRNFSLTDVHFTLPDPLAEPDEPGANPTVSGTILVTAGLPSQMNFAINVTKVRADADVLYHGRKLGELNLRKWQAANSTMTRATADHEATLRIQSRINEAPLNVTDGDVLTEVIQKLIFGGEEVDLDINALVDIRVDTVLGQLDLKDVPAAGKIPVKPLPKGTLGRLEPHVGSIEILDTTPSSVTLEALVNITNPTQYTARIPLISIHVLCNDTIVGVATAKNLDVGIGNNTNLVVGATWNPTLGGKRGLQVGRDLLSEFLSGYNPSLTVKTYRDSIPFQPLLGEALSRFNFTLHAPRIRLPGGDDGNDGDGDNDGDGGDGAKHGGRSGSFIRDATFHVFSSTASFTLVSPLTRNTLFIDSINATAFYNHTESVGTINTDEPFAAPPGLSETPKLPVEWSPDSVGFEKLRKALGGVLKLDAKAVVGVRLGAWRETVWYEGRAIGAHVRP